ILATPTLPYSPDSHIVNIAASNPLEWTAGTVFQRGLPAQESLVNRGTEPEVCIPECACPVSSVVVPGIPASRQHGTRGTAIHSAAPGYRTVSTRAWTAV